MSPPPDEVPPVRDSCSLKIVELMEKKGILVKCYDPFAMENSKKLLPNINYFNSANDACVDAEGIIIATEWDEFKDLNFSEIKKIVKSPVIFDLRNIIIAQKLKEQGFEYYGIGK